ncbi:cullin family protein [Necator americanus]|uniref:Cullin family protein n=1 Tax=Necator americanus TaxID=51031 RepID=W2T3M2_NECAM|nr:cullin family protein [Necator americanus]ETN76615.1 cullin family protein [Necator americanus]
MDIWKEHLIEPILDKLVNLLLAAIGQDRLGNVPPNKDVIAGVISSFLQKASIISVSIPFHRSFGFNELIIEERKDLRNMYRLLKPIPSGLLVMAKEFEDYVRKKGLDLISTISGENVPQQFVDNVLKVHEKFHAMKTEVFMDDGDFAGALDKALQSVVNVKEGSGPPKASERLARYTDNLLRKSAKGMSESEVDLQLSKAIVIFRYIEDKDVFQKYYSKMLASRLIMGFSVAMDAEEAMINKLKHLESTHTSVQVSMQPLVLQAGSWPLSAPQDDLRNQTFLAGSNNGNSDTTSFILPAILQPSISEFEKYYIGAHNGRKLTWLFNMSHGELRLTYLDKPYLISMSVHQMSVILCFQDKDTISVSDISVATGICGDTLIRNVRSILDANILTTTSKDLNETAEMSLNKTLTCKRLRFRLTAPQIIKNAEKEAESVSNTVTHDRKYYMECAIVRIMKTRKVLKHNALISEVCQLRGRNIESRMGLDLVFAKYKCSFNTY